MKLIFGSNLFLPPVALEPVLYLCIHLLYSAGLQSLFNAEAYAYSMACAPSHKDTDLKPCISFSSSNVFSLSFFLIIVTV